MSKQLFSVNLSEEDNKRIFGKCNSLNGHGHNYSVEISLKGPIDRTTGMVYNLTDLKQIMDDCIMKPLDHKNIDKDVLYFKTIPSTAENIAVYIWDSIYETLHNPDLLFEVKLYETDKNIVSYRGNFLRSQRNNRKMSENCVSSDSE